MKEAYSLNELWEQSKGTPFKAKKIKDSDGVGYFSDELQIIELYQNKAGAKYLTGILIVRDGREPKEKELRLQFNCSDANHEEWKLV